MAYFEVQEFNLCGGWANNWSFEDDTGNVQPSTFDSYEAARAELFEFLADCDEEVAAGNMPDAPEYTDFRIVEVQHV
jgi:hypothetical protein